MEFQGGFGKVYNITNDVRAVGVTTGSSRPITATDSERLYLNSDTGNDSNGGTGIGDELETLQAAYTKSLTEVTRRVIYITNSAEYTVTADLIYNGSSNNGIESKDGETPTIDLDDYQLVINFIGDYYFYITNCFLITSTNLISDSVTDHMIKILAGGFTMSNCHLHTRWPIDESRDSKKTIYVDPSYDITGVYGVSIGYSCIQNDYSCNPILMSPGKTASKGYIYHSIVYHNADKIDDFADQLNSYDFGFDYLPGAYNGTFSNLTVTQNSGVALIPNRYKGYILNVNGVAQYKIKSNDTTKFYLEDVFGAGEITANNVPCYVYDLYTEAAIKYSKATASINSYCYVFSNIIVGNNTKAAIAIECRIGTYTQDIFDRNNAVLNTTYGTVLTDADVNNDTSRSSLFVAKSVNWVTNLFAFRQPGLKPIWAGSTIDTNIILPVSTDYTDNNITPMYFDRTFGLTQGRTVFGLNIDGSDTAATCWRLRELGKKFLSTDADYMRLTSPLVKAGYVGKDLCPWHEVVTLVSTTYASLFEIEYDPAKVQNNFVGRNASLTFDINGNPRQSVDKFKREFALSYGEGQAMTAKILNMFEQMLQDKYPKKWYPKNGDSLKNETSGTVSQDSDGNYRIAVADLWEKHWVGYWITIDSKNYYIHDNGDTYIEFTDKLDVGYPSLGSQDFTIEYMLVHLNITSPLSYGQFGFTGYTNGGSWDEVEAAGNAPYSQDLTSTITLMQAENEADV